MQLNTKKCDTFCSHIFDYAFLMPKTYRYRRSSKLQKLYTSKTFLKKLVGGSIPLILPPWIRPWP